MKLTPSETDLVDWALDPMRESWCTENGCYERDGAMYQEGDLPTLDGDELTLSAVADINDDLEYRITEQMKDMADDQGGIYANGQADPERMRALGTMRAIKSLSRKCGW